MSKYVWLWRLCRILTYEEHYSFENEEIIVLDWESRSFEGGAKEALYVKSVDLSLNKGGGLHRNLGGLADQESKRFLAVSRVCQPHHKSVTNCCQEIIWLDDVFWIGRETSSVTPVSPVDQIIILYADTVLSWLVRKNFFSCDPIVKET